MEMHQIRYVLAAAEHLNFTRAAAQCDVSQPALTKGIKALESELDAALFHREGRRIILSHFGQMMLPHLREIASEAEAARSLAKKYHLLDQVPVRLGVQVTIGPGRFGGFFNAFDAAHGSAELAATIAPARELAGALGRDEIDLAVVTRLPDVTDGLSLATLYTEGYVAVFPKDHPLANRSTVTLEDLNGHAYVDRLHCEMREAVRAVCAERSVDLYARFRAERDDWIQDMVHSGLGFAFMPEHSVTLDTLAQVPLVDPVVAREICLASVPGRPFPAGSAALARLARSFAWKG